MKGFGRLAAAGPSWLWNQMLERWTTPCFSTARLVASLFSFYADGLLRGTCADRKRIVGDFSARRNCI